MSNYVVTMIATQFNLEIADTCIYILSRGKWEMTQSTFWVISSINFLCILGLTFANILVTRQTTKKINYLTRMNNVELKQHEKMIQQFSNFLAAIDETRISLPVTVEEVIMKDENQRENLFSELRKYRSDAEIAYYQLLLVAEYSRTDFTLIEAKIKDIFQQYRSMFDGLFRGMIQSIQYGNIKPEYRDSFSNLLLESTKYLAEHSRIRESFADQKDSLIESIREYMNEEIKQIRKDLDFDR